MKRMASRLALLAILAGIVSFSGGSDTQAKDFIPCPVPSCMAPCFYPPPPQVLCRIGADGDPFVTSFTCCCCGSGRGVYYSPL